MVLRICGASLDVTWKSKEVSRPTIRPSEEGTCAVSFSSWSLTFQVSI
jgi:hypothetical protein